MFRFIPIVLAVSLASARAVEAPDFNREVRPILSNNCFKCHGPDDKARKGKLRLDLRDGATKPAKSGETALVAGKPDESELLKRINSTDDDEHMPPPVTKKELTAAQKDVLQRWIAAGAKYDPHWAFVPPKLAAVPALADCKLPVADWKNGADGYGDWSVNPIDGFILKRLADEKLMPSREADPETLCRRIYFDLIGLPPTPEEVDDFVKSAAGDSSSATGGPSSAISHLPSAIASLADRLLASPRYGERWARPWLDLARYSDTNGYEKDRDRSIWPWRDWVINALNADMPYDRFSIEQIAGDLLPNATPQQIIATGFHRNTMLNEEGGIDPLEFRFNAMTDRMRTTGKTWLGLTIECAQCHTHKFDPITQREYYQVFAFLNNADEPDYDLPDPNAATQRKADDEHAAKLLAGLADQWPLDETVWETPKIASFEAASGEKPKLLDDQSALFPGSGPDKDVYTITLDSDLADIDRLKLETLADPALPSNGPGRVGHGNFVLTEIIITAAPKNAPDQAVPVKLVRAESDIAQDTFPAANAFDGDPKTGWAVQVPNAKWNVNHTATFGFEKPVNFPGGTRLTVRLEQNYGGQHTIGRPRLSVGAPKPDARPVAERRHELVEKKFAEWLARERARTVAWTPLHPTEAKSNSPFLAVQPDDSVLASGDITKIDTYELKFRGLPPGVTALRLEALPDERLPHHGPGLGFYEGPKGDFFMGEFQATADSQPVKFARASDSYSTKNAMLALDGDPQTGWNAPGHEGQASQAVFVLEKPLTTGELSLKMIFGRYYACSLGRFRISATTDPRGGEAQDLPDEVTRLLTLPETQLTDAQHSTLREQFLLSAPELSGPAQEVRNLRKLHDFTTTLVMRERPAENPRPTFIHNRGEYLQPTDRVEPGVLAVLNPLAADAPRNRLGFARWLVSPANPLTARVAVNRAWAAFFGRGIVKTVDDFGYQGEPPTHPELLDYLAIAFSTPSTINPQPSTSASLGWSMKKLHRLIVTSAAYQQASRTTPETLARDPQNTLLARGPRLRLDAEMIRDAALRIAGVLTDKLGGPSVRPPQPAGVTEVAYSGSTWTANEGPERYRRSLYTFSKRTAPFAMYTTFDGPAGDTCIARRDVSDTPLQALTTLNDVVFLEAAQALGKTFATLPGDDATRLDTLFRRFFARPPRDDERALLAQFLQTQRARFSNQQLDPAPFAAKSDGDPAERAAWTALARALFNTDEAVTKG